MISLPSSRRVFRLALRLSRESIGAVAQYDRSLRGDGFQADVVSPQRVQMGECALGVSQLEVPSLVFMAQLQESDYQGMVSIECRWKDFAKEASTSVAFLRMWWHRIQGGDHHGCSS